MNTLKDIGTSNCWECGFRRTAAGRNILEKLVKKKGLFQNEPFDKLKYAGVKREDLIDNYKKFIRSVLEFCSVAMHGTLTESVKFFRALSGSFTQNSVTI